MSIEAPWFCIMIGVLELFPCSNEKIIIFELENITFVVYLIVLSPLPYLPASLIENFVSLLLCVLLFLWRLDKCLMKSQINIEFLSQEKFFWRCLWLLSSSRLFNYSIFSKCFSTKVFDLGGKNVNLKLEIGFS